MHPLAAGVRRFADTARRHPTVVDAVLAAAVAVFTVPQLVYWWRQPDGFWVRLVLSALLVVPLAWRRRFPLGTFTFACAVALVQFSLNVSLAADIALFVYLYTVASRRRVRVALLSAVVLEAGVVLAAIRWNLAGALELPLAERLVFLSAMVAVALAVGVSVRVRRQALAALTDRAERLERERDQQAALAVSAERARIARDLHDVVAHSLSVMVTLSDAAVVKVVSDPDRAGAAMRQVSATGRQSLAEMRRLLGVLRDPAGPTGREPQPGIGALGELVERVRETGMSASLVVEGEASSVSRGVDLTVYRIVQEAVTNVLKHATSPSNVDVAVDVRADAVVIDVSDDGATVPAASTSGGLGLFGMRERVAVYGGELTAGPRDERGWHVHALLRLPRDARTPATDAEGSNL
jgi:signal transduction histidine kinase